MRDEDIRREANEKRAIAFTVAVSMLRNPFPGLSEAKVHEAVAGFLVKSARDIEKFIGENIRPDQLS